MTRYLKADVLIVSHCDSIIALSNNQYFKVQCRFDKQQIYISDSKGFLYSDVSCTGCKWHEVSVINGVFKGNLKILKNQVILPLGESLKMCIRFSDNQAVTTKVKKGSVKKNLP
jgi:hypothetical protein